MSPYVMIRPEKLTGHGMSNKAFWGILAVVVVVIVGVFVFFNRSDGSNSNNNNGNKDEILKISEQDHVFGNPEAEVTLVEYADFQCPFCQATFPILKTALTQAPEDFKIVFRHFPLTAIHPNAMTAHRGAEAAGLQGKFEEMHDLLYERHSEWTEAQDPTVVVSGYAEELGLDMDKYAQDVNSNEVFEVINGSLEAGGSIGVESTPTIFVNGTKLDRAPSTVEELLSVIAKAKAGENPNDGLLSNEELQQLLEKSQEAQAPGQSQE